MALAIPSRDDLHTEFIADYALAQPGKNTSRGSDPYILGRVVSGVAWSICARLLYFAKQMLPDTCDADYLARWGTVFGVPRLGAAGASGAGALSVSAGASGGTVPVGTQLTHADGTIFQVTTALTVAANSTYLANIAAISTGAQTNKVAGEVLTFSSTPTGINPVATLVQPLTGGQDVEATDAWRARILARIADPPGGGTVSDYQQWALSVSGVAQAYVYKNRRGVGTVDIAVLGPGTGAQRVITNLTPIQAVVDANRPAGMKDATVITAQANLVALSLQITIDTAKYKWDWDDLQTGYVITAYDPVAMTLTVPTAPASVVAGVRIQVNGFELQVVSRTGNVLTLAAWPTSAYFSITAGVDGIRASGDLVVPVQNAVTAYLNTLGPARGFFAVGSWPDTIRTGKVEAAAEDVPGIVDSTVLVPSVNFTPPEPAPALFTYFAGARIINVWKAP